MKMSDLKESIPIQLAEYALNHKLEDEAAFRWWVHKVMQRAKQILKALKSNKYWLRTHKYGVELPHSVKEALAIDRKTGTDYWAILIGKEMTNNMVAFQFNKKEDQIPVGHEKITAHMVFDMKLGILTRKAQLCGDGHKVPALSQGYTYSSVPSQDSV